MRSELDRRVAGDRLKTSVEKVEEVEEAEEAERAQVNRGGSREGGGEEGGGGGGGGGIHGLGTYTHTHTQTHTDTHRHRQTHTHTPGRLFPSWKFSTKRERESQSEALDGHGRKDEAIDWD